MGFRASLKIYEVRGPATIIYYTAFAGKSQYLYHFYTEPFNCHESLLWEGFETPILADSRASLFPIMHSENRKLNGSAFLYDYFSLTKTPFVVAQFIAPLTFAFCMNTNMS